MPKLHSDLAGLVVREAETFSQGRNYWRRSGRTRDVDV
jgi:hypothetical protein